MSELGSPWLPGPGGVVLERIVLACTVGGVGRERFLAWVPGEFQAHSFEKTLVAISDMPHVRPTGRFWWVHEQVQGADGIGSHDAIAFARPGIGSAEEAFAALGEVGP